MDIQDIYQDTIKFVANAHNAQTLPGTDLPYLIHLTNVAMEVLAIINTEKELDKELLVKCALLHDIIEDTEFTYENIKEKFGEKVAKGVLVLTKDSKIENKNQLLDSLERIKKQPKEIWIIKMADRIVNLHEPPSYWTNEKRIAYKKDAEMIYDMLKDANRKIASRLKQKIDNYSKYIEK